MESKNIPAEVISLIKECVQQDPKKRPTAKEARERFTSQLEKLSKPDEPEIQFNITISPPATEPEKPASPLFDPKLNLFAAKDLVSPPVVIQASLAQPNIATARP